MSTDTTTKEHAMTTSRTITIDEAVAAIDEHLVKESAEIPGTWTVDLSDGTDTRAGHLVLFVDPDDTLSFDAGVEGSDDWDDEAAWSGWWENTELGKVPGLHARIAARLDEDAE